MDEHNKKKQEIMATLTAFLHQLNQGNHEDVLTIFRQYLTDFKKILDIDLIIVIFPLLMVKKFEEIHSSLEQDEFSAIVTHLRKIPNTRKKEYLDSITKIKMSSNQVNDDMSFFDEEVYHFVLSHPLYTMYKYDAGKGGIFFLNKEREFDADPSFIECVSLISEAMTIALNRYRLFQLNDMHFRILQETQVSSKNAVCIYTFDGFIVFINKPFSEMFGVKAEEAEGNRLMDYVKLKNHHTVDDYTTESSVSNPKLLSDHGAMYVERADGSRNTILRKHYLPIMLENKWFRMITLEDVSHELENIDNIEYSSFHDTLTNLKNRNYFDKNIKNLLTADKLPLGIVVGDINGLKLINDIFGHEYGDEMIKRIASILETHCSCTDLYRVGGDEFYMFLNNTDGVKVSSIIEKINEECEKAFKDYNFIGISLGYYLVRNENTSLDSAIKKAETEMYYIKSMNSEQLKKKSIDSLKKMYEDKFTAEHERSKRLLKVAKEFSAYLDLRDFEIEDILRTLEMIDVGKVAINYSLLGKKHEQPIDEFESMKKHCHIGYKIASLSYETSHLARVILNHHENWDGSGFPQGIRGNAIPYLTRIIRIIDYFDNLSQSKMFESRSEIIDEFEEKKGKLFDPAVTEAFIRYLSDKNEEMK